MKEIVHITSIPGQAGDDRPIEMVETKGLGHPDTICDCLAEEASLAICKHYLDTYGIIKHYNVDKALLVGGSARPCFGGGEVTHPMEFILAGRIAKEEDEGVILVAKVKKEINSWLKHNLRYVNPDPDFEVKVKVRPGADELIDLSSQAKIPLANDTSFGTGFYPYSTLEQLVEDAAHLLNDPATLTSFPFVGEDIKVMGIRNGRKLNLTVAVAIVSKFISSVADYQKKIDQLKTLLMDQYQPNDHLQIEINEADNFEAGNIYLTVTGTSAEQGDDGQVGRGNRVNGLITPYRPMSLEAVAGKNPLNHVGKIYNHFAQELSQRIVEQDLAEMAQVFVVSQIGQPIDQPQLLDIEAKNPDKAGITRLAKSILAELPLFYQRFISKGLSIDY